MVSLACRFDLLFRKNPFGGEYTVFAGLEECVRFAANLEFKDDDIKYLKTIMPPTCEVSITSQNYTS
jgi:nicotinate phosphoribosyltransferase